MRAVSIVIPTLNEEETVTPLTYRINHALVKASIPYEVIFVDDHSTDKTRRIIKKLAKEYPISLYLKQGVRGKAFSLLEGFSYARYPIIAMIDADLQYPPEAIAQMVQNLSRRLDIIVGRRIDAGQPLTRLITSRGFQFVFGKLLHGLTCDVQSGLKVFKKEILGRIEMQPTPWTFDLEFLVKAKDAGYAISDYLIPFEPRQSGETKVNVLLASLEIGWQAFKTKLATPKAVLFDKKQRRRLGFGFHYKGLSYVTHTNLAFDSTAAALFTRKQKIALVVAFLLLAGALLIDWKTIVVLLLAAITLFYFLDLFFNLLLISKSLTGKAEISVTKKEIAARKPQSWPTYTVLCPLYKEWPVAGQFVKAISRLDYPKNKLQVLLLLESDDIETILRIKKMALPKYFSTIIVPDAKPKTKPKACNYGMHFANGEYTVIFDAEDVPDKDQLKKAALAFAKSPANVVCMQAKLNYYNPKQNILTRVFTAEYSLWFDLVLVGLQSLRLPIPLGGTSNHFKSAKLKALHGWDAFNVTEDCDIGIRLSKLGYQTAIVNSTTLEEANSKMKNWLNQRTRWIKGYMQTYVVHMRFPLRYIQERGLGSFLAFQVIVGGKICSLFINPVMWCITIAYFAFRSSTASFIEPLFPTPVLYIGVTALVFGNFLYVYYYMIGCAKKGYFDILPFAYLVPFYWLAISLAGCNALVQLIIRPHHWSKTAHGFHLANQRSRKTTTKTRPLLGRLAYYQSSFTQLLPHKGR